MIAAQLVSLHTRTSPGRKRFALAEVTTRSAQTASRLTGSALTPLLHRSTAQRSLAAVVVVRRRQPGKVALHAGGKLVGVVLGREQRQLRLAAPPATGAPSFPAEPRRQPRPLRRNQDSDGAGEQDDPEPAHEPDCT